VKFIRLFLTWLALAIVLVAILVAAAFSPIVQTWAAQVALAEQSGVQASLGSLSAGFGRIEVTDLHLEVAGTVLTLPSLQAKLPLTTAVWDRKIVIQSLVAKGWTLDLSHLPVKEEAPAQVVSAPEGGGGTWSAAQAAAVPAQQVARIFRRILRGAGLPGDVSLDGVDLEGNILVAAPPAMAPARVHVTVKGGGIAAGHEGALAIDAAGPVADPRLPITAFGVHGRLVVAMDSPRTLNRIEINASLTTEGGSFPEDLAFSAGIAAAKGGGEETYTFDLSRGSRHLATVLARFPEATRRLVGTWMVDWRDSELAPFSPNHPLPSIAATGNGHFEADAAFSWVHAVGHLNAVANHLGILAPPLDCLGAITVDARFDVTHSGQSIRIDQLKASLVGIRPAAVLQSLQPFSLDEHTGDLKVADPRADWMEGLIQGIPLSWLSGLTGGFTLTGADMTGEFVVRTANGEFALHSKAPLTAAGVSVQRAGKTWGQGLDLSLSLLADFAPKGWQMQWAPLTIGSGGRRLATIEAKASRIAQADQPIVIAGTWNADLEALASQPAIPGISWTRGLSASGDFSASVGGSTEADVKLAVTGHDPGHVITASAHADVDADGTIAFLAPIKIAFGSSVSEVAAQGTWAGEESEVQFDVKLTGENVALEHLALLAAPLAATGSAGLPANSAARPGGAQTSAGARDQIPFWGDWTGRVKFAFDRMKAGDDNFSDVAGTFEFDHGSIHLEGGQGGLAHHKLAKAEGLISFDAAAEFPYSLKAAVAVDELDAAPLFGAPQHGHEPVVEGRFSVACTLTGNGINLSDLVGRTQEEFRLTSTVGIVRLLRTSVALSFPDNSGPVSDALGHMGSLVGSLFGVKGDSLGSGKNPVSKTAEAVLNFTYQVAEIGYDQVTVNAIQGPDRTIRLVEMTMSAPDERLTGSGQITYAKGLPLSARPLSVELQLGVRGALAKLLSNAGLLSSHKDNLGYALLSQPIHFGGTLEHIDGSQWHDLLVKAATQIPDGGKKGG
jgi:hypothetical protein